MINRLIKSAFTTAADTQFYLTNFSGKTSVTLDIFARRFADHLQLKCQSQDRFADIVAALKAAADAGIYEVDIRDQAGLELIQKALAIIKDDVEASQKAASAEAMT